MSYQNGTSSETNKPAQKTTTSARNVGSEMKSGLSLDGSPDFDSSADSEYKTGSTTAVKSDMKSSFKAGVEKVAAKLQPDGADSSSTESSVLSTVVSAVASFLPIKNGDDAVKMLQTTYGDVQTGVETARESAASFVRKYPFYSLVGAGLIGAAVTMMLSSKKSSNENLH